MVLPGWRFSKWFIVWICILCLAGLVSCNSTVTPRLTEDNPRQTQAATATPSATPTPAPSPTPTEAQPLALLIAPNGAPEDLQAMLKERSQEAGIAFETRSSLSAADLTPNLRLAVILDRDPGLAELSAAAPETQFLAVGLPDLPPAPNLSQVGSAQARPDQVGYLAGYLAASLTEAWRVGVINNADTVEGKSAQQAFINGVVFYCGLCRPPYPPFYQYPAVVEVRDDATDDELISAADSIIGQAVETVFIAPGTGNDPLIAYLADQGVNIIGTAVPPQGVDDHWITTIETDLTAAVEDMWQQLMKGEGSIAENTPLAMTHRNPALFSPGKQNMVEAFMIDLSAGFIDTGVDPLTGNAR